MKRCGEMRSEARKVITGNGWFWRLMMISIVFQAMSNVVSRLLNVAFAQYGIQTWDRFLMDNLAAIQKGIMVQPPPNAIAWHMTGASMFQMFIAYIFTAIAVFGVSVVIIKALRNDSARWFGDSLKGFGRPLELAWLMALINLKVMLWSMLFVIPGIVAIYRYRQAWFLKAENPDWSASQCIRESGKMMKGYKGKAFLFDLSYVWWVLVAMMAAMAMATAIVMVNGGVSILVTSIITLPAVMLLVYVFWLYMAGRVVFYKEIKENVSTDANNML